MDQEGKRLSCATATRSLRRLKARIAKVGGKRNQPKKQAWKLKDTAKWEFLFQREDVFWKTAGAIRAAGYDSIYSLTQDAEETHKPLLTGEEGPRSRGTRQEWLTKKELQQGIKDPETVQLFVDNRTELEQLADAIRNQDPIVASRVEVMSGGEVLGTALIAWLKEVSDDIGIARKVVEWVWPRACAGRAQTHPEWAISCGTKLDLIQEIESWVRKNSASASDT